MSRPEPIVRNGPQSPLEYPDRWLRLCGGHVTSRTTSNWAQERFQRLPRSQGIEKGRRLRKGVAEAWDER